ncbi:MAG: cyclase family protein [Candidatus Anammoxibacter sp.]
MKNRQKIYDISLTISEDMATWPKDPKFVLNKRRAISGGDSCNVSQLEMGSHTGTHIDAPYHFEEDGTRIDSLELDVLVGKARVFDIANENEIGLEDVKELNIDGIKRVLFRTVNSNRWKDDVKSFTESFVAVTSDAAKYLVDAGIKLVGIDYLSIEKFGSKAHDTHHTFLKNEVIVIEGLNLADVTAGDYELIALPLKIKDGDGSPARVILKELAVGS